MTKLVDVDCRGSEYIVSSYSQTPPGFWQMNGYFSRVGLDSGAAELGEAVLTALDVSNRIALTDVLATPFAPVLDALGLKNFSQYMKGTVSVGVEIGDDGDLRITPKRNGGAREGFVAVAELTRILADRSAESVGAAVREAMTEAVA